MQDTATVSWMSHTMMLLCLLLSAVAIMAASDLPEKDAPTSLNFQRAALLAQTASNETNIAPLVIRGGEMQVGSSCQGFEAQWNCMITTFQRCASGQWSMVLNTAYGTVCEPDGLTYDFQPAFASWYPPADVTETVVCTATATPPSDLTDTTRPSSSRASVGGNRAPHPVLWVMVLGFGSMPLLLLLI
jgi:hypothetical protein